MDCRSLSTVLNKKSICLFARLEEDVVSIDEYKCMFNHTYSLLKTFTCSIIHMQLHNESVKAD